MSDIHPKMRPWTTSLNLSRLFAILSLALILLAIPAVNPDDASALRMSERTARSRCLNAGGSVYYDFSGSDFATFDMTCTLPSGNSFNCVPGGGPFGNMVDCY